MKKKDYDDYEIHNYNKDYTYDSADKYGEDSAQKAKSSLHLALYIAALIIAIACVALLAYSAFVKTVPYSDAIFWGLMSIAFMLEAVADKIKGKRKIGFTVTVCVLSLILFILSILGEIV